MILHAVSLALKVDEMILFDLLMRRYIFDVLAASRIACDFSLYTRHQCHGRGAIGREVKSVFGIGYITRALCSNPPCVLNRGECDFYFIARKQCYGRGAE